MIKSIKLENWKTHHSTELEFGKGTNVLVGEMGSGKSSVMDAVSFALFGTFPALKSKRVSMDEVIMGRPNEADFAKICLEFDYREKNFRVERTIKRGGKANQASLYIGEKLSAGPKVGDVNERISKELSVSYDLFSRAVYSEQNQIDFFLRLSPRDRKEKFDELLDLKRYETARASCVTVSNRLGQRANDLRKFVEDQKNAFSGKETEEMKKRLEEKTRERTETENKISSAKKISAEADLILKKLEEQESEYRVFNNAFIAGEARLKEMADAIAEAEKKIKGRSIKEIAEKVKKLEKELDLLEKEKQENNEKAIQLQARADESLQKKSVVESKIKDLEKHFAELEGLGAECPVCKSELDEKSKAQLIEENQSERKKLEENLAEETKKSEKIFFEKNKLEEEKSNFEKKFRELSNSERQEREILESAEKLEENRKKSETLKEELEKTKEQIKALLFDEKKLSEAREKLSEARLNLERLIGQEKSLKDVIEEIEHGIKLAKKAREHVKKSEKEVLQLEEIKSKLELFRASLIATQAELRETLVEGVNSAMDTVWQRIYPYQDYVSARMEIEQGSYELKVKTRSGAWVRVEGILSGGERSAAALCIRIAFSLVLTQNLSWLILDEPTHNLDSNAVRKLSEMLRSQLPEMVEQIFIITHDKEMEKAASSNLYLMQRDKDNDGTTKPVLQQIEH